MSHRHTSQRGPFRPEIEGLRGVAVLLVVLFHASLLGVAGGFVGVDVFFVLSGFLITGLLLRERGETGRIRLTAFYARRVRRLLPAAAVVLVATLAASWALLDPLSRIEVLIDGAASALSIGNVRFALVTGDYFAPVGDPSPFLQFWSLGVEEQFYLVWPLLLLVVLRGPWPRLAAAILMAAVLAGSFAVNLALTATDPAWAFYSLPSRAWQLALGGMLAVAAPALARLPARPLALAGWAGIGAIAAAGATFDPAMAWPGTAALVPAIGAAAVIVAGDRPLGPGRLLSLAPLRFLGRISYSLYLWHWPLLVLAPALTGQPELPLEARLGLAGLSILLAAATCLLVEEPFRFGVRGRGTRLRPASTLRVGVTAILAIALAGGTLSVASARELDGLGGSDPVVAVPEPTLPLDTFEPEPVRTPDEPTLPPTVPPASAAPSEAPPSSTPSPSPTPRPSPPPTVVAGAPAGTPSGPSLPADLQPPLARAATDHERLKADRCIAYEQHTEAPRCSYGQRDAAFTVALVGDSHASHWFPALEAVARANGWRVVPFVKVSCPFVDLPIFSRFYKREYTECAAFRESTIARLEQLRPDLTIVAQNKWVFPLDPDEKKVGRIGTSLGRTILRVPGRVVILFDTPHAAEDVPACLAANPDRIDRCATPRSRAMGGVGAIEKAAAAYAGVPTIDLSRHVCIADPCPAVVNGIVVYRDYHHLTATYSRSLAGTLGAALRKVIG